MVTRGRRPNHIQEKIKLLYSGYFKNLPKDSLRYCPPEVDLWRAVLDQALFEYALGPRWFKSRYNRITPKEYNDVAIWLHSENPDFRQVCALADLDQDVVFEIFKRLGEELDPFLRG